METETGQTRMVAQGNLIRTCSCFYLLCADPAEDFDLDSLLYDIVKFDPTQVVQQHQHTQQQQPSLVVVPTTTTNNVQQVSDAPEPGAPPTVNEQQSPQDGNISL